MLERPNVYIFHLGADTENAKIFFSQFVIRKSYIKRGAWKYCDARSLIIELINFCPDNSFREMNFSSAKLCLFHELDRLKFEFQKIKINVEKNRLRKTKHEFTELWNEKFQSCFMPSTFASSRKFISVRACLSLSFCFVFWQSFFLSHRNYSNSCRFRATPPTGIHVLIVNCFRLGKTEHIFFLLIHKIELNRS